MAIETSSFRDNPFLSGFEHSMQQQRNAAQQQMQGLIGHPGEVLSLGPSLYLDRMRQAQRMQNQAMSNQVDEIKIRRPAPYVLDLGDPLTELQKQTDDWLKDVDI